MLAGDRAQRAGALHAQPGARPPALARLREALAHGRFVAYQPTCADGRQRSRQPTATPAGIRADLQVLRPRFDALITYDAVHGAQQIAPMAASLKFRALIIGVWNPFDAGELDAALAAARRYPQLVVGISLGNEMLFSQRADPEALARQLRALRSARAAGAADDHASRSTCSCRPETAAPLLAQLDFLLANVHPVFQPWFRMPGARRPRSSSST